MGCNSSLLEQVRSINQEGAQVLLSLRLGAAFYPCYSVITQVLACKWPSSGMS